VIRARTLLPLLAVLALAGCRQGTRPSRAHGPAQENPAGSTAGGATGGAKVAPPVPCGGVGTPWDGHPQGCAYELEGCCYVDAETACKVAACPPERCQVLESYPAQIACDPPASG
jgi:hypothetical protein